MGQQTSKLTQNNVSAAVLKHLFPGFRVPILKLGPVLTEKKLGDLFLAMKGLCIRIGGEPTRMPSLKNDKRRSGFRSCMAVAVMMGPSLAYGSPACMTQSEARAKFPKAHLYWHGREQCWNDKAAFSSRALAAVPAASRPVQASVPVLAPEFGGPLETIRRALLGDTTQAGVPAASPRTHASARGFLTTHTSGSARGFATTRTRGSARAFLTTRIDDRRLRIAMSIATM